MAKVSRRLLVQEVNELTALLRHEPNWQTLRDLLRQKGLAAEVCLLAGFMESEEGEESGVVVAPDGTAFEYGLRSAIGKQPVRLIRWRKVEDPANLAAKDFPALRVGVEMAREAGSGQISE